MNIERKLSSLYQRFLKSTDRKRESSEWFESRLFHSLPRTFEFQVNNLLKEGFGNIEKDRYSSIPYAHLLAIERGTVIGVTGLFKRLIVFNRETVTMGGLGYLTTKKKKRRKGVATALLRRGIEDFRMRNFDMAFLCTNINNPAMIKLYGQVGFVPLGKPYTYTGVSGTKYVDHNGMVAPVKPMDKFKHVLSAKEILDIGAGAW